RRDVVRIWVAGQDHQNLLAAVALQYFTEFHPLFAGGLRSVGSDACHRPQRSFVSLSHLSGAFRTLPFCYLSNDQKVTSGFLLIDLRLRGCCTVGGALFVRPC